MKQYKIFAPVLLAVLGLASFEKNESGVLALTDEQKQTLMNDHGWEAKFLDQFNAALAVNFEDAQATQEGDETPTTLANLDTLNETARALAESQTALAALQADKNALEVDKAAMQKKVNDLTTQVDVLSRKPEHDAGAGAQTPNQMTLEEVKWNDTTHLGGRQAPMFALEGRPYNVRARAAMLAAQGETMITVPSQQSTDFSKLQEDLGAYYREQRDKQIKSFVTELPTVEKIFPLESNLRDRDVITNLFLGEFSQADNSESTFDNVVKGKYDIQSEEVRMYDVMLAHEFKNLKQMEKSWIGYLAKDSSSIKMSFIEYLLTETAKVLHNEREQRRVRGARKNPDVNVPGRALEASTGLYRFIHEKVNGLQIKPHVVGEITQANIGSKVFDFVKGIPQQLIDSGMLALYMPTAMVVEYDKYNETHYGTNQDYKANIRFVKEYPSVKIIPVPNAGNHRRLICTLEGNLKTFENVPGEMLNFHMTVKEFSVSVISQWKEGFGAPLVGKKWDRAQDMDYDHQFIFVTDVDLSATEYLPMGKDDATPSALFHTSLVSVANSVLTTITNIDDAEIGKLITLKCGSDAYGIKIVKENNFSTIASDWTPGVGDTITLFKRADGKFMEYARTTATPNVLAFTADDTTPSVAGGLYFQTNANTATTAITDLDDAVEGTTYTIYGAGSTNASTIANSGNFVLTAAMTLSAGKSIVLLAAPNGKFVEVSRV